MRKMLNKKGFTLAELLIVVAIIAVLVAIAIPVFTTQLERSKEATDMSNLRAAYAEVMAEYLASGATSAPSAEVSVKQAQKGWQNGQNGELLVRVNGAEQKVSVDADKLSGWVVSIDNSTSATTLIKVEEK